MTVIPIVIGALGTISKKANAWYARLSLFWEVLNRQQSLVLIISCQIRQQRKILRKNNYRLPIELFLFFLRHCNTAKITPTRVCQSRLEQWEEVVGVGVGVGWRLPETDGNVAHIIKCTILRRVFTYKIKINYRKYCVLSLRPMHPVLLRPSLKV